MLEQADALDYDGDKDTSETTRSFYHRNALGSVMEITDMNEAEVESMRYDPYGTMTITVGGTPQSGDVLGQHWGFTGRFLDEETGSYYYRARCHLPVLGRFGQRDPIGYAAGPNLYEYCYSSPLVWIDRFGMTPERYVPPDVAPEDWGDPPDLEKYRSLPLPVTGNPVDRDGHRLGTGQRAGSNGPWCGPMSRPADPSGTPDGWWFSAGQQHAWHQVVQVFGSYFDPSSHGWKQCTGGTWGKPEVDREEGGSQWYPYQGGGNMTDRPLHVIGSQAGANQFGAELRAKSDPALPPSVTVFQLDELFTTALYRRVEGQPWKLVGYYRWTRTWLFNQNKSPWIVPKPGADAAPQWTSAGGSR